MPHLLNTPTSPLLLLPGCVLVLTLALLLLLGYRRSGERLLLWVAVGFAAAAGLALWLGSYFVLVPAFVVAALLYLRDAHRSPPVPVPPTATMLAVAFRVQAQQARIRFGTPAALQDAAVNGLWEHHATAAPGTSLVLHVQPATPFAAELWCDGQRLAHAAPPALAPVTLQAMAQPTGATSPLQQ